MTIPMYIIGASGEIGLVRECQKEVEKLGYKITHDWTKSIKESYQDKQLTPEEARGFALDDLLGVCGARVIWILVPPDGRSKGSWVEFGAAAACSLMYLATLGVSRPNMKEEDYKKALGEKPMVIASGDTSACIFLQLADKRFDTHPEALAYLKSLVPTPEKQLKVAT